ncbi:DMT family transporter [Vibrio sp. T187]|uniref:DMT family transporter n=1 Tax=Vibrio TaxID=662 RepID=UPI0010C9B912|nr:MULTISPECIES: DMT family transporter [Vibrio]MBW3698190.1 DMT family transporter [Vibrio sp. T187]
MLLKMIPFVFVMLWASGFIGARLGLEYAEPATLLTIRMVSNVAFFLLLIALLKRKIPRGMDFVHSFIVGALIHGFYLGGSYLAIGWGMPAGLSSLLVGLQPILTALLIVGFTAERFKLSQWLGLGLGFIGICLVLIGDIEWQNDDHKLIAFAGCMLALIGITFGTLYQKRYCKGVDMVGSALIQYLAAGVMFLPAALHYETMEVQWTMEFILTMVWLVVVLSCVAILLLLYMVENGAASAVASVFYMVPPVTAIQAWLMFGETFDALGALGFVLAAVAVYLVVKKPNLLPAQLNVVREKA